MVYMKNYGCYKVNLCAREMALTICQKILCIIIMVLSKMECGRTVGMIHAGTPKTDVKMNKNLNTYKLTLVLNR